MCKKKRIRSQITSYVLRSDQRVKCVYAISVSKSVIGAAYSVFISAIPLLFSFFFSLAFFSSFLLYRDIICDRRRARALYE